MARKIPLKATKIARKKAHKLPVRPKKKPRKIPVKRNERPGIWEWCRKNRVSLLITVAYLSIIILIVGLNQPDYTPVGEFDEDDLSPYEDGDELYIIDTVTEVEDTGGYSGSWYDHDTYDVTTDAGYSFSVDVTGGNIIHKGSKVVLKISITQGTFSIHGTDYLEFVMEYNHNLLIVLFGVSSLVVILIIHLRKVHPLLLMAIPYSLGLYCNVDQQYDSFGYCLGGIVAATVSVIAFLIIRERKRKKRKYGALEYYRPYISNRP